MCDLINRLSESKTVIAFSRGCCGSAAYKIACCCHQIICTENTLVGSIGTCINRDEINTHYKGNIPQAKQKYQKLAYDALIAFIADKRWKLAKFTDFKSYRKLVLRIQARFISAVVAKEKYKLVDMLGCFEDALDYLRKKTKDGKKSQLFFYERWWIQGQQQSLLTQLRHVGFWQRWWCRLGKSTLVLPSSKQVVMPTRFLCWSCVIFNENKLRIWMTSGWKIAFLYIISLPKQCVFMFYYLICTSLSMLNLA